jgi:hypothetical protein
MYIVGEMAEPEGDEDEEEEEGEEGEEEYDSAVSVNKTCVLPITE